MNDVLNKDLRKFQKKCIERETINRKLQWICGRGNMQFRLVMVGILWFKFNLWFEFF